MRSPDAEALPWIAPLGLKTSWSLCSEGCRAYHGVWGFLRLYGVLPSVERDHDALMEALTAVATSGARRALVSGSADAGLFSYLVAAWDGAGAKLDATVVDLCGTPLRAVAA